ncbi:endonuclease/exonuclease/phosphatase family protein [Streptomyces sp. TLI_171]|uniref:endonuclease/exonuclease/phosphatase family protein n=1 Tax=Streptomyces sp. TLI_171 TaxID=1938859 RepID=UPI000C4CCEFC|nr:endonuclease/exonuclease/phosphatase family protein [Streptomyces sp. TLI_171]RKE16781.1 endonuclease/exonuclease/phosphatase family metal-dependent hydrolase [Streptomyces sp. TLI_171]
MTGTVPAPLRLVTFNVLHGRRPSVDGPSERVGLSPLAEAVAVLGVDVLALQDLDRGQERSGGVDQARALAEAAGARHWRYATAFHARAAPGRSWVRDTAVRGLRVHGPDDPTTGGGPSHGVALYSRLPVLGWHARRFGEPLLMVPLPAPGRPGLRVVRDHPRVALAAVLRGPGGPFTAVAVHLSFVPGWNVRQLLALRSWLAGLPGPHLLLGDFNLPGAVAVSVLRCAAPGDGWRELLRAPTFPAHRPRSQLDHLLAAGLGTHTAAPVGLPRFAVSDHRPLAVDLTP